VSPGPDLNLDSLGGTPQLSCEPRDIEVSLPGCATFGLELPRINAGCPLGQQ